MKATFFIGCTEWRAGEHHCYIQIEKSIDIEYLQRLFRDRNYYPRDRISNDVVIDGNCFMVLPTNSQIRKCHAYLISVVQTVIEFIFIFVLLEKNFFKPFHMR